MNILFFLTPKSEVAYINDDDTLRQALETMEFHKYAAVSVKKHDGSSRFSIYLFYKMRRLLHAVPVNIENHLN